MFSVACLVPALVVALPAHAGETIKFTYDNRGRLTGLARTGSPDDMTTAYSYDNADNRTNFTAAGVSGGGTTPYPNVVIQDPDGADSNWNSDGSDSGWGGDGVAVDPGGDDNATDGGSDSPGGTDAPGGTGI